MNCRYLILAVIFTSEGFVVSLTNRNPWYDKMSSGGSLRINIVDLQRGLIFNIYIYIFLNYYFFIKHYYFHNINML